VPSRPVEIDQLTQTRPGPNDTVLPFPSVITPPNHRTIGLLLSILSLARFPYTANSSYGTLAARERLVHFLSSSSLPHGYAVALFLGLLPHLGLTQGTPKCITSKEHLQAPLLHFNNLGNHNMLATLPSRKLPQANMLRIAPTSRLDKLRIVNTPQVSSPRRQVSTLAKHIKLLVLSLSTINLTISSSKRTVRTKSIKVELLNQSLLHPLISPATIAGVPTTGLKIAPSLEELYPRKMP
jgi:hypothetical protein